MNFIRKTLIWFFIVSLAFSPETSFALVAYPSPDKALDQIMKDLGMEGGALKKTVSNTVNVASYKKGVPTVALTFVPENPINKKELTVIAVPAYFTGNVEQMYYTWYLKHAECVEAKRGDSSYVSACDLTKDDQVDIEDWKVEAMRLVANGGLDPASFDYSSKSDEAEKEDGYESFFGGEDQRGKPAHCYVRDIEKGIDYELVGEPGELGTGGVTGDGTKGIDQLPVDISEVDFSQSYAASIAGDVGKWSIGPFLQSVVIPNVQQSPGTAIFNYAPRTWPPIWNPLGTDIPGVSACADYCSSSADPDCEWNSCSDGIPWIIWEEKSGDEYTGQWKGDRVEWLRPGQIEKIHAWNTTLPFTNQEVEGCKSYGFMVSAYGNEARVPYSVNERTNIVNVTMPGEDCTSCRHLFPKKYYVDGNKIKIMQEDDEDLLVGAPQKKKFTLAEEKFWGTDPSSADTNNDGVSDEKALTGLGMLEFKWTYRTGDQVGVAVEGVTDNTDFKDSSMKTMWGLPLNNFKDCPYDLNECLGANLINPAQGTKDTKIEANLSYLPKYPVNDPNKNNSDDLVVKANLSNIENKSFTNYNWTVSSCTSVAGSNCTPLTPGELGPKGLQRTRGIGLDSLKLKLAFPDTVKSLKFVVTATEDTQETSGKIGKQEIVVPLQTTSDRLQPKLISVTVDDVDDKISLSQGENRYDLATDCPKNSCPVVKNEIVGLKYSGAGTNLQWYLNGQPLSTAPNSKTAYFPVLQNVGSNYSIRLDVTKDAEKITLTQNFNVETPTVKIIPGCAAAQADCVNPTPVVLGEIIDQKYPDDSNKKITDYSQTLLEAKKDSVITLKPFFNFEASVLKNEANDAWKYNWYVDGIKAAPDENGNLKLTVNKAIGEKHKIGIEAIYTQSGKTKKALTGIWNIPKESFYESTISASAEILVIIPNTSSKAETNKIMASLFSHLPEYLSFLFRIFVTMALLLFFANLIRFILPKKEYF